MNPGSTANFYRESSFSELRLICETLPRQTREWDKTDHFLANEEYVHFIKLGTGASEEAITQAGNDWQFDRLFRQTFGPNLLKLESLPDAGDLRFHSLTLYLFIRLLRPRLVVETGVAHGKSSSAILLALSHNNFGSLLSFDLFEDGSLRDGQTIRMSGQKTGWLVPSYLRDRWTLKMGDSIEQLALMKEGGYLAEQIDIFFHDSLHTYEHLTAELDLVAEIMSPAGKILCDNLEMESGRAIEDFAARVGSRVTGFGNFGCIV